MIASLLKLIINCTKFDNMCEKTIGTTLHDLRKIATIVILNILHVTANIDIVEKDKLFYILLWTTSEMAFRMDQDNFVSPKCQFQNCLITKNASYLDHITNFDAILFDSVFLYEHPDIQLPHRRSRTQRYVFVSTASSADYPITPEYNNFFNWTWTYKFDSDVVFSQIAIRDLEGKVIGPKKEMHWLPVSQMKPIRSNISSKLENKTKTAMWLATSCDTDSQSQIYIKNLQEELRKYNDNVDIYGHCEQANYKLCTKNYEKLYMKECEALIESTYFFYLSFESILSEDFVSSALLKALKHFAVPIVLGGANHTRYVMLIKYSVDF